MCFRTTSALTQKHVDFVICDKNHCEPVLAIKLNDITHEAYDRWERDIKVSDMFHQAQFPLLFIQFKDQYDTELLTRKLEQYLKRYRKQIVL